MSKSMEKSEVFRTLKCVFTEKETAELGRKLAACRREINRLEDELDSIKKKYAGDIKEQEGSQTALSESLNTGWEMRRVACEMVKNFKTGTVVITRKDTKEPVEERAMTGEERQKELGLKPKNDPGSSQIASGKEKVPGASGDKGGDGKGPMDPSGKGKVVPIGKGKKKKDLEKGPYAK